MRLVRIDQLQVGDVVASDVRDVSGKRLVNKGVALTARHVRALRMWGAEAIAVDGDDLPVPPVSEPISPEEAARLRDRLGRIFRLAPLDHPAMARLFEISLNRQLAAGHAEMRHDDI
jgi:hypothetical protein